MKLEITKVTYYDIGKSNSGKFLAKCSVVLEDLVAVHDIKILNGNKGRYVIMPLKAKNDKVEESSINKIKEDVFHPVNKEYFGYMSKIILEGYKICEESGSYIFIP